MESDPDLPPATPLTSPVIDEQGRLTYVGTDGRRYVVLGPRDQEAYRQRSLQQSLDQGSRELREIERQGWIWSAVPSCSGLRPWPCCCAVSKTASAVRSPKSPRRLDAAGLIAAVAPGPPVSGLGWSRFQDFSSAS